MSSIIDYTDRTTCVIFGDGAGAVVVEASGRPEIGIIDFENYVDGSGGPALCMPAGGSRLPASHETVERRLHYVKQDGQAVFKFAVRNTEEVCRRILDRNGVRPCDIDLFVSHQANRRIILSAAEKLGLPEAKVVINIDRFGNTTAATIPLALNDAIESGRLRRGDLRADGLGGCGLHGQGLAVHPRIFLLSPANCTGRRAALMIAPSAEFPLARQLQAPGGAPIGEVFSFVSGLYFRGKLASLLPWQATARFARPPGGPSRGGGVLIITPTPDSWRPTACELEAFWRLHRYRRSISGERQYHDAAANGAPWRCSHARWYRPATSCCSAASPPGSMSRCSCRSSAPAAVSVVSSSAAAT
jgi:hypothetical protein